VWEWVQDCWHDDYKGAPTDGSAWLEAGEGDCGKRVIRGGSWNDDPGFLRASARFGNFPDFRYNFLGFRLVQDMTE
jgi:formylglycine-generating enzyme required for sulfatase activity